MTAREFRALLRISPVSDAPHKGNACAKLTARKTMNFQCKIESGDWRAESADAKFDCPGFDCPKLDC